MVVIHASLSKMHELPRLQAATFTSKMVISRNRC